MENGTANNHAYPQTNEFSLKKINIPNNEVLHNTKRKLKKNIIITHTARKITQMGMMDLMKISCSLSSVIKKK
jgi:hypothetical protein